MVLKMLTFMVDEDEEAFNFPPGSPPYMGSSSSSSSLSLSSPDGASSSCIGGIINRRFPSPTYPSRLLQLQHKASHGQAGEVRIQRITTFSLPSTTTLVIQKGDITKWFVNRCSDAIVNATNELMFGRAGVHGAIHKAAGPELYEACCLLPEDSPFIRCPTGQARITLGYKLPASRIIHTAGPWFGASIGPQALLESAYRSSLSVAKDHNIQYIAFPAVSCGERGYPLDEAAKIALSTVKKFSHGLKEVHFVLFQDEKFNIWCSKATELLRKE